VQRVRYKDKNSVLSDTKHRERELGIGGVTQGKRKKNGKTRGQQTKSQKQPNLTSQKDRDRAGLTVEEREGGRGDISYHP